MTDVCYYGLIINWDDGKGCHVSFDESVRFSNHCTANRRAERLRTVKTKPIGYIVVWDDASGIYNPMGWSSDCKGALVTFGEGGRV